MAGGSSSGHLCPVEHVRPVVAGLPRAAGALSALLTCDSDERAVLYAQVARTADEVEAARVAAMASLARIQPSRRARAVRLTQSVSLVVGVMVAVARVAAESPLRGGTSHEADILRLCDEAMLLVLPTQRRRVPAEEWAWEQGRLHQLENVVSEVSAALDELLVELVRSAAAGPGRSRGTTAKPLP